MTIFKDNSNVQLPFIGRSPNSVKMSNTFYVSSDVMHPLDERSIKHLFKKVNMNEKAVKLSWDDGELIENLKIRINNLT